MDYSNHFTVKWLLRLFAYISQELPLQNESWSLILKYVNKVLIRSYLGFSYVTGK